MRRQLIISIFLIFVVIALGTVGYSIFEGWGLFDSLYMTVITITTIGFKEVHELSATGRAFTVVLIFFSVGAVFYSLNNAARILIEGELRDIFGRRKVKNKIKRLKGHYIVCGYGRMGKIICKELKNTGVDFVIIEKGHIPEAMENDLLFVQGDATLDETLREAGIAKAKGLISVLSTDAENLYVVLSARGLNPSLNIVARAVEEGSEQKLIRAGADRALSPYYIGGQRIAHTVLKPAVVDFIEFTTRAGNIDIRMEEIRVEEGSPIAGQTLDQCGIGRELGILVVAIKKQTGQMEINPTYTTSIVSGDTIVAIGEVSKLSALENMAKKK
jgi:voltage-gated potassium channel